MNVVRIIAGAVAVGGVAVFGGVQAFDDETSRDDAGQITKAGGLGAYAIRVGDCIQLPDEDLIVSVEGVPCDAPHDAQAYATFDLTLAEFDVEDVDAAAFKGCLARWDDQVFADDFRLDVSGLMPTRQSWVFGDREVVCLVISVDGSRLRGSRLDSTGSNP